MTRMTLSSLRLPTTRSLSASRLALALAGCLLTAMPAAQVAAQDGAGTQPTREELEEQFKVAVTEGRDQLEAGDFAAAVQSFDTAVQLTGGANPTPLFFRARALMGAGEYEAALEDIKNVLTYGQSVQGLVPEARNLRAEVYLELGAVDRALKDAEAAVKANRNNPAYQLNYGKALVLTGNASAAEKALSKYLATDDQTAEPYRLRAQAYAGLGKFAKGLADIERAIELDPSDHENHYVQALIFLQEENYIGAADALRSAINNY
ncbi:MAG: tetratricopeptide repeat protein, partial [Planctomycetota bacterium]